MYNFILGTLEKRILFVLCGLVFVQMSAYGQEPARLLHWNDFDLKGKVKTVDRQTYRAVENFEKVEKGEGVDHPSDRILKFDKKGNLIEEGLRLSDGLLLSKELFSYTREGKLETRSYYDENENLILKETFDYNEDGKLVVRKLYDEEGNKASEINYILTDGGKSVKMEGSEGDAGHGETHYKAEFRYDEKAHLIEKKDYYLDYETGGWLAATERYEYNNAGNKIKETFTGPDEKILGSTKYRHDKNGNLLEIKGFEEDGALSFVNSYEYDAQNRVVLEMRQAPYENIQYKNLYKYDDRGGIIEELMYDESGRLSFFSHYEYSYDRQGNWIQKIEFKDYRPKLLVERKITYYDQ